MTTASGSLHTAKEGFQHPWLSALRSKRTTAAKALRCIKRGNRVFVGSGCGEPQHLSQALEELVPSMADLAILHILSVGKTRFTQACFADKCRFQSFFVASASREAVAEGRADYTPISLGDIPTLFRSGAMPIDVALIQVSPPDEHGFCSYGIAVDIVKAAAESARRIVAQINPRMPRTLGDSFIHVEKIHAMVEHEEELLEVGQPLMNPIAEAIGRHVARIVEDGSTIRVGVGSISTAVLYALEDRQDLGVHADMLTDAYLHLVKQGVITNAKKSLHPGKIVTSFCLGSRELYDFAHNNPFVAFYPTEYTNNFQVICQNDKMVSINSAVEIDLSGQVCSDSLGYEIYSGVGGATDFLRGARHSRRGKAIVVLPSTTLDGKKSRIVADLTEGGGVVTTRGGVQYVVTEYGIAHLHGKSIRERALALIGIAHPQFREDLMRAAQELNYIHRQFPQTGASRWLYPQHLEVTQIFEDDVSVLFRPSKLTDERALKQFFYSLPRDESYVRFVPTMKVFPHYDVHKLLNIDYRKEMNIFAVIGEMDAERIIGVSHYDVDETNMTAEMDFAVHPDYARRGIASFLIHYLVEIARKNHVQMLKAYIAPGNERVFGVFQKLGYLMQTSYVDGVYEIRLRLEPVQACLTD